MIEQQEQCYLTDLQKQNFKRNNYQNRQSLFGQDLFAKNKFALTINNLLTQKQCKQQANQVLNLKRKKSNSNQLAQNLIMENILTHESCQIKNKVKQQKKIIEIEKKNSNNINSKCHTTQTQLKQNNRKMLQNANSQNDIGNNCNYMELESPEQTTNDTQEDNEIKIIEQMINIDQKECKLEKQKSVYESLECHEQYFDDPISSNDVSINQCQAMLINNNKQNKKETIINHDQHLIGQCLNKYLNQNVIQEDSFQICQKDNSNVPTPIKLCGKFKSYFQNQEDIEKNIRKNISKKQNIVQNASQKKQNFFQYSMINQIVNNEMPKQFEPQIENKNYAKLMLNELLVQNIGDYFCPHYFLNYHEITGPMRAKMIDWMIEVMQTYKCATQTFFLAVNIMDRFFKHSKRQQPISELHIIGVTCMFIASKYEEIYPIRLDILQERIAHGKIAKEEIKNKEVEILDSLNYCITGTNFFDTLTLILSQLDVSMYIQENGDVEFLKRICIYMAKMACFDYELLCNFSYQPLSASCIYVAFKILEQVYGEFQLSNLIQQLRHILKIDNVVLIQASTSLLYLARNFQEIYPNLYNLKKFNNNLYSELSQKENYIKVQKQTSQTEGYK